MLPFNCILHAYTLHLHSNLLGSKPFLITFIASNVMGEEWSIKPVGMKSSLALWKHLALGKAVILRSQMWKSLGTNVEEMKKNTRANSHRPDLFTIPFNIHYSSPHTLKPLSYYFLIRVSSWTKRYFNECYLIY